MSTPVQLIQHEGRQIADEEEIDSAFNEHFINVDQKIEAQTKMWFSL